MSEVPNVADHSLGKEGTPLLIELANRDCVSVHIVIRELMGCCGHKRNQLNTTDLGPSRVHCCLFAYIS